MEIKPNCRRCYYGGLFDHNRQLASCDCKTVTEPTIIAFDTLFMKERQYVSRKKWEDECDCDHFIPHLSETVGDYELEPVCSYNTEFDCPFCGETVYVYDIGVEVTEIVTCDECGKQISVEGKCI